MSIRNEIKKLKNNIRSEMLWDNYYLDWANAYAAPHQASVLLFKFIQVV